MFAAWRIVKHRGLRVLCHQDVEVGFATSVRLRLRIAINRYMKREGKVWIRIFPDKPITSKPAEVRMGKDVGAPSHWVAPVRPGRIMFEVDGVPMETAQEALRLGAQKLPVKCKFVVRPDYAGSHDCQRSKFASCPTRTCKSASTSSATHWPSSVSITRLPGLNRPKRCLKEARHRPSDDGAKRP